MKNTLLLTLLIILSSNFGFSQITITTTSISSQGSCDGIAYIYTNNEFANPAYTWTCTNNQDTTQFNIPDSIITNLCAGNYSVQLDSNGAIVYNGNFTIDDPCSGFIYTSNITHCSPNTCDGSFTLNPIGGTAPYTFMYSNGATVQVQSNLCVGNYTVTCTESTGCIVTASFLISTDSSEYLMPNMSVVDDNNTNCTGSATCSPTGGVPPYTFNWSTGSTTSSIDSLCAGVYSLTIWDANSDSTSTSFVVTDSTTTYGNNPFPGATISDTLYSDLVTNCTIEYSEIDSASLYLAVYDSVNQNLYVTWVIYTPTDTIYVNDTLGLAGAAGYYTLVISVYCPTKSINDFLKIQGTISFNGSSVLKVEENLLETINVYPNPFNNVISFDNKNGEIRSFKLIDLNGRIISESDQIQYGLVELKQLDLVQSGSYLLILSSESSSKAIKIMK